MKFCTWTHPKTGATRIYINGLDSGLSVFVVDGRTTGHYPANFPEIIIKAKDGRLIGQSQVDSITDAIDEFVRQARPSDVNPTFADYLALAQ